MHISTPPGNFDADGEFPVYLNIGSPRGPFGVIDFGPGTYAHIEPEYAERMIRALAKIIAYDREYREIHAFEDAGGLCARCGTIRATAAHADPCGDIAPHSGRTCTQLPGHDGLHRDAELVWDWAEPVTDVSEAAGMLAAAITAGTPVLVTDVEARWCPGTTFMEHEEVTLYCDRDAGHDGSHHAPGPDEGSEVAWSDEPASSEAECALPRPRPADRCKCGHIALYHHLNLVTGETVYCNECPGVDDCAAFSPAEPATVAS